MQVARGRNVNTSYENKSSELQKKSGINMRLKMILISIQPGFISSIT